MTPRFRPGLGTPSQNAVIHNTAPTSDSRSKELEVARKVLRSSPWAHHTSMYYLYVLQSESSGRRYIGHTSDFTQRLGQHNNGITKSTKNRGPWKIVYREEYPTKAEAARRERLLKTGQGREELKRLLSAPRPVG